MFLLFPKASKFVLHYGVGNLYVKFRTSLVSAAVHTVQLDHLPVSGETGDAS